MRSEGDLYSFRPPTYTPAYRGEGRSQPCYIAYKLEAPETAQAQTERIEDAILTLETLPERCRVLFSRHGHELRRLMVDNYSIFYYIKGTAVIVTDILYSKSDIDRRLEEFGGQQGL